MSNNPKKRILTIKEADAKWETSSTTKVNENDVVFTSTTINGDEIIEIIKNESPTIQKTNTQKNTPLTIEEADTKWGAKPVIEESEWILNNDLELKISKNTVSQKRIQKLIDAKATYTSEVIWLIILFFLIPLILGIFLIYFPIASIGKKRKKNEKLDSRINELNHFLSNQNYE